MESLRVKYSVPVVAGVGLNVVLGVRAGIILLLVLTSQPVVARGSEPAPACSIDSTQTASAIESVAPGQTGPAAAQSKTIDQASAGQDRGLLPGPLNIRSLLIDKEIPLIGGRWGGEIMVDAPLNGEPDGAAVTLRRAKLKYNRGFGNNWQLKLTADYTRGGGLELSDNYFVYKGWNTMLLTLGIEDPPFSLESVSSSAGLTFMERSLAVNALSEAKSGGIAFLKRTPKSILNGMFVLFNPEQDDLRQGGQAIIFHYVHSPITLKGKDNIHVGGSFSYRLNTDANNARFRSRPEIATANTYFVDTGEIDGADKVIRASLEASRVSGRLSWQAELLSSRIQRNSADSLNFWGAYAFISWFLSDDSRNYDSGSGKFGPLTPSSPLFKGGRGAFEVAFRASYVDLTDKDIIGGVQSNLSLGFNWYPNYKLRFMANVVKVLDVDRPGSEFDNQDPLIIAIRAQWLLN